MICCMQDTLTRALVFKIPYRRAREQRYLNAYSTRAHEDKVSCIQSVLCVVVFIVCFSHQTI